MTRVVVADVLDILSGIFYTTAEGEELDPYNGHQFCLALKRSKMTDRLEAYTKDGSTRYVLSTISMRAGLGFLLTQRPEAKEE